SEKIKFVMEHNGKKHRFASFFHDDQLLSVVRDHVASIVSSKDFELFWNDDESNIVLDTVADLSTAIDYSMQTKKRPTCSPCVRLTVGGSQAAAPAAMGQLHTVTPSLDDILKAAECPPFDPEEKDQLRAQIRTAISQHWSTLVQLSPEDSFIRRATKGQTSDSFTIPPHSSRPSTRTPMLRRPKPSSMVSRFPMGLLEGLDIRDKASFASALTTVSALMEAASKLSISPEDMRQHTVEAALANKNAEEKKVTVQPRAEQTAAAAVSVQPLPTKLQQGKTATVDGTKSICAHRGGWSAVFRKKKYPSFLGRRSKQVPVIVPHRGARCPHRLIQSSKTLSQQAKKAGKTSDNMADKEEAILALLEADTDGIAMKELVSKLDCSPLEGQTALNSLLASHKVELRMINGSLRVKQTEEPVQLVMHPSNPTTHKTHDFAARERELKIR
ncbi:hypothetical protein PENTCL1PPCAC_23488, partial [Pristionchus entomophagus]